MITSMLWNCNVLHLYIIFAPKDRIKYFIYTRRHRVAVYEMVETHIYSIYINNKNYDLVWSSFYFLSVGRLGREAEGSRFLPVWVRA